MVTMTERLSGAGWARQRSIAMLLLTCAVMALLLAAVGLYSVVSCAVSERRRELALRVALGASRRHILAVLRATARAVILGASAGLTLTFAFEVALVRWTEAGLWSAPAVGLVIVVLAIVSAAAVVVPTLRAVSVDPMAVLRSD
jgi:ABC-type antimicrobial peptide transport system permease subunit